MFTRRAVVVLLGGVLLLTACRPAAPSASETAIPKDGKPVIVVAAYPLEYAVKQIVGENANVVSLTPAGVEPHDVDLSAQQVVTIGDANLVLYIPGLQPAVDEAVEQNTHGSAVNVLALLPSQATVDGVSDPHFWLDPANMTTIGGRLTTLIDSVTGPAHRKEVTANGESFTSRMTALDKSYWAGLQNCSNEYLLVGHEAYGYLASAYGFEQIGVTGVSPDAEPSAKRIADMTEFARSHGVTTVYEENAEAPAGVEVLADEIHGSLKVLNPVEMAPKTGDYETVMRDNLKTLITGQRCITE